MCGRYAIRTSTPELAALLGLEPTLHANAIGHAQLTSYNIAPTQPVLAIRKTDAERAYCTLRWGLIPSWAKDLKIGARLINARGETVADKPAFRTAFRRRRCLLPASGFFEWKKVGKLRQPYYFRMADQAPFCFAGLWERWQSPDGETFESASIITTHANEVVKAVHHRMPVILDPKNYELWLSEDSGPADLNELLAPFPDSAMIGDPVSTHVNKVQNNDASCIEPIDPTTVVG
ncbi:MAG: SOS response-associated peptidase [Gammaproteobacteria bacterium]|nr:SOS response-associated peptidase [Gammaproteobacteria bacterium]